MANTHPPPPFHILLADDGSRHAQSAIELIKCLPLTSGSEIHAVTVFTPRQISEHERLRAHVLKSQESLLGADIDVSANLVLGYPAEKIIEISEDTKPNLIVIGAKGLRATMGILLGGVAQQVVEYAKSPVLVVRAPFEQLDNILLVTDGSICSEYAASYLTKLPLPRSANIRIMHVLPPVPVYTPIAKTWPIGPELLEMTTPDWSEDIETWKMEDEEKGRAILETTNRILANLEIPISTVIRRGDAATEINSYVEENAIDLIVAGSRGLNPIQGWLLGSVSRKLIHYSKCSVLVVKADEEICPEEYSNQE